MYEPFYGLHEQPFDLSPDPRFLFLSRGHQEALLHLEYGLKGRSGLTMLVGEAGTGKTTLVARAVLSAGGQHSTIVHLSNPTLTRTEFFQYLAGALGFGADAGASKVSFLQGLQHTLAEHARDGAVLALIVDEAQSLPDELLEEVRLLTNMSVAGRALAVALVGQPELAVRLNEPKMRQLKQRIALRCSLGPLNLRETAQYIASRVRIAGGRAEEVFASDAIGAIHERASGIPRTISVICDNALVNGFAANAKPVTRALVLEVCRDFDLGLPSAGEYEASAEEPSRPEDRRRPATDLFVEPRPLFQEIGRPRRFSFF